MSNERRQDSNYKVKKSFPKNRDPVTISETSSLTRHKEARLPKESRKRLSSRNPRFSFVHNTIFKPWVVTLSGLKFRTDTGQEGHASTRSLSLRYSG